MTEAQVALHVLLGRIETVAGPSRELDAQIHVALHPSDQGMTHPGSPSGLPRGSSHGPLSETDFDAWRELEAHRGGAALHADHHQWPAYTASADAALELAEALLPGRWSQIVGDARWPAARYAWLPPVQAMALGILIALTKALIKAEDRA